MADQASLFNEQNPGATPPAPNGSPAGTTPPQDEVATLLMQIKNESGEPKYKSVQEALKALQHSQTYIPTLKNTQQELEQQLQTARAEAAKVKELEQAVLQLTQRVDTTPTGAPAISEERIAELVNQSLSKTQQAATTKQNQETVVNAVKAKFGDKAEEVFYKKAQELGLSVAEFNAMAARTPKAVLELVGVNGSTQTTTNLPGMNTAGFQPRPDSAITKNKKSVLLGATTQDIMQERQASAAMVDELHSQGKSVHDLTDPKVFFKLFA